MTICCDHFISLTGEVFDLKLCQSRKMEAVLLELCNGNVFHFPLGGKLVQMGLELGVYVIYPVGANLAADVFVVV